MLYIWFWNLSFVFINRLHIKQPRRKKILYTIFFFCSLVKWLSFIGSMAYILHLQRQEGHIDDPKHHLWFQYMMGSIYILSDIQLGVAAYVYIVTIKTIYTITSTESVLEDDETNQGNQE